MSKFEKLKNNREQISVNHNITFLITFHVAFNEELSKQECQNHKVEYLNMEEIAGMTLR